MPFFVRRFIYWFCLAVVLLSGFSEAQAQRKKLTADIKEIVFANRFLSRKFALDKGWLRTSHFANLLTGESLITTSPEFQIKLENEVPLTSDDFVAEYYTPTLLANDVKQTLFTLMDKRQRFRLELEYTLGPNDFFMRKRMRLYPLKTNLPRLLWVSVEALKIANTQSVHVFSAGRPESGEKPAKDDGPYEYGFLGQPVYFNDSFFWGMEHPASRNGFADGILTCTQDSGRYIPQQGFESHSIVAGISPRGEMEDWFLRYVDTFRLPSHPFTIYKIQNDGSNKYSQENLKRKFEEFRKGPQQPYDIHLDAVVLAEGWLRRIPPWQVDTSQFPDGLGRLREYLESKGSGLGLYLPLNGPFRESETHEGFETLQKSPAGSASVACFCLAGTKYKEALKKHLKALYRENSLRFVRHDVVDFLCISKEHGHPTEESSAVQAATDALIEVLRLERSLSRELYISLAGKVWPSPWWLQYANNVCLEAVVRGYRRMNLSPRVRDWEINHLSFALRHELTEGHFQFPLSHLTTGGLTRVLHEELGSLKESEDAWADGVAEYLSRGQDLTDLDFNPQHLNTRDWEILDRGLRWKTSRKAVFQRGALIGGDPDSGEPHGYLNWNSSQAIALLRNPSPSPREVSFQLPKSLRGSLRMFETYPRCRQELQLLKAGDIINTSMEGLETRVLEMVPDNAVNLPLPLNTDFRFLTPPSVELGFGKVVLRLFPDAPEIRFSQPQAITGLQLAGQSILLDSSGQADLQVNEKATGVVEARKSLSERKAEVGVYAKRGAQLTLPEWPGVTSALIVWLVQPAEQPGMAPLYITLNRKQLDLGRRESFNLGSESKLWSFYSIPLSFPRQALLDWAIKDVKEMSLYLWWTIQSPRPALEINYTVAAGKAKEILTPLLLSPREESYVVHIPLETGVPEATRGTP